MKALLNRNFLLLGGSSLISVFGDAVFEIALAFAVYRLTGSTALLSVVMVMNVVPVVLFGFFAGVIVDWHSKRSVMILTDMVRGVAVLAFGLLFLFGVQNIPVILICCALISTCNAFYMPAYDCAVPQMMGNEHMIQATSAMISIMEVAQLVGKAAGGFLLAVWGAPLLFMIDGATFLVSGLCALLMHFPDAKKKSEGSVLNPRFLKNELHCTHDYIKGNTAYRNLVLATIAMCFFSSISGVLVVPLFDRQFTSELYGLAMGALSLGAIAGSAIMTMVNTQEHRFSLFAVSALLCNGAYLVCPFIRNAVVLILLFCACGVFTAVFNSLMECVLILSVPEAIRGKVSSTVFSAIKILSPVGMLLGGFLGAFVDIAVLIPASIALNILSAAVFLIFRSNHTLFAAPVAVSE